jgi:hypothetical protein
MMGRDPAQEGMKRDSDPPPEAGPPSRAEIEAAVEANARRMVAVLGGEKAMPGCDLLFALGVDFMLVGPEKIPTLTDDRAAALVRLAETDPHAFDAAGYVAGLHVGVGHVTGGLGFPAPLRTFAALALAGHFPRPPEKKGRKRAGDVPLLTWAYALCRVAAVRYGIPLARNREAEGNFNACQAVANALSRAGRRTSYSDLETLCYGTKGQPPQIRALAEALGLLDFAGPVGSE